MQATKWASGEGLGALLSDADRVLWVAGSEMLAQIEVALGGGWAAGHRACPGWPMGFQDLGPANGVRLRYVGDQVSRSPPGVSNDGMGVQKVVPEAALG
jgi:hypothetical protein